MDLERIFLRKEWNSEKGYSGYNNYKSYKFYMRDKIIEALVKATGLETGEIHLETPENEEFGDYSSNITLQLFSKSQIPNPKSQKKDQSPITNHQSTGQLAQETVSKLKADKEIEKVVDKIEIAGPGFINFWLKKDVLVDNLIQIDNEKDKYGRSETKKNKKVSVEFTDPNPFKEFHIGHLYSNTIGESLARLQEALGATVWRADYFGDAGIHVAKSIWGLRKKMQEDNLSLDQLGQKELKERINYMGQGYTIGSDVYEEDKDAKKEIERLNTVIYLAAQRMWKEKEGREPIVNYDPENKFSEEEINEIYELYVKGRSWSLEYFEQIYARLGTKFDGYYPESVVGEIGYKYVLDNLGSVFEKSEGAIIYKGEKVGLHTRVFINKHNLPTYEAKELGLAPKKYEDFKYDESIIVTGNEINEYFKVLISALKEINPKLGNATLHLGHGMVRLPEGKMSSRTGKIVTAEEILDEVKSMVFKILEKSDVTESEKESIAEKVAIGSIKYSFLKTGIGQDIIFDFDKSLSLEGNSGPYLQYTYARTQSVGKKALGTRQKALDFQKLMPSPYSLVPNSEEIALLRTFTHFSDIISMSAKNYSPNLLCNYLYDLAQKFNLFYNMHGILEQRTKDKEQSNFRLALTSATGQVLKNGLYLLGIEAPGRM
ncbi:arginine--tRNA ligase [Candidatus Woesebacteria bacterium RIFCSPHIGHO2_01_FULL_39_32]|uniref:Arginine--tRNA ligase n=1 Tax=Candidatus Woesebacteria bacterium RIFCSPLOWO2_01_FULL_39_25 TaxID=1802521 RepID=A0A1F8BL74_9BACT|nr:MAG: arginine--tRNA ligase [Candidatus Woesebacteria bacterium RIFCSPHIGHO2_01_FULL_39_32]OGM37945.1 MAG: arginine--tRNA ligase [Candidatus Woesebacteria bacterium RIFCSPHIGHO2_12_FULL_38_11]OGM64419.1 MAG: arginine--tRNA ligase [Candidatus Woesebacteria bacterium RIFCSPLOWO2_01_FULL_39_25]